MLHMPTRIGVGLSFGRPFEFSRPQLINSHLYFKIVNGNTLCVCGARPRSGKIDIIEAHGSDPDKSRSGYQEIFLPWGSCSSAAGTTTMCDWISQPRSN
jgi:hypothetical protein